MKDQLRVCILTTSFPLYEGNVAGPFVAEQARYIRKLGVQVVILAPHHRGANKHEVIDGNEVHRFRYIRPVSLQTLCYGSGIPSNLKNSWWARAQLPFLLAGFILSGFKHVRQSDIIQANWSLAGLAGIILGRILKKPVVLHMYGAEVFILKDNPVIRFVIKHADHVVAISNYTLKKTIEIQQPRAYSIISPGIDIRHFQKKTATDEIRGYLKELGIDFSIPIVFALGRLIERKGFAYLIDAIAKMQASRPVQLILGGRGPLKNELQRRVDILGISNRVIFIDYIADSDLPAYYTVADVFILPSVVDSSGDTEGLGMVLLEAMGCGTPCVASEIGGIIDIVKNEKNGLLAQPKNPDDLTDKILRLLEDESLSSELAKSAHQFVEENFSWETKALEVKNLYMSIQAKTNQ